MELLVTNWDGGCAKLTFPSVLQATVHQIFTTNLPEVIPEKTAGKAPAFKVKLELWGVMSKHLDFWHVLNISRGLKETDPGPTFS